MKKLLFLFFPFLLLAGVNKFIKQNSYIIDPYNNNRVTSEAQGYGMLYAVDIGNETLFDSLWKWTKKNMQTSFLFGWKYNDNKLLDKNDATDGDMFIIYSLLKAYVKWHKQSYFYEAKKLLKQLKELIVPIYWKKMNYILLPARYGFVKNNGIYVYPSYYIPFIFKGFYKLTHNVLWLKLYYYSYSFAGKKLSDEMKFSLLSKKFIIGNSVSMNVYRVIPYAYMDSKNVKMYKKSFEEINRFFDKNDYIPLIYYFNKRQQMKKESPYCVYKWFYMLYKDKRYLKKYNQLKKIDKNNYFCTFLDELLKEE